MLENETKLPINSFQGITYRELEILGKSTFSRGFENFFEMLTKNSRNPERKWISLKFSVLHM